MLLEQLDSEQIAIYWKVLYAMLMGAVIGLDREKAKKPAGLRTYIFVSGSATLLVSLGNALIHYFNLNMATGIIRTDPVRIIEAIITGISFIAAGTIIRNRDEQVKGLTTAASLLLAAAVGIAVAVEQYLLSFMITITAYVILRFFWLAEQKFFKNSQSDSLKY